MAFKPDKSKFKDTAGKYITQNLFLEHSYDTEKAVYTFADEDKEYNGVIYPSLRKLYLEIADPTEYEFANTYLWGWEHWQRIAANKVLLERIERWREELEVKIRSQAVGSMLKMTSGNFNAAKWAADGHWNVKRGRPSKEEQERERKLRERALNELTEDSSRVIDIMSRKEKSGG